MPTNRMLRVNEAVRRELAIILPKLVRLRGVILTLTGVEVAPDLKRAEVFLSLLGGEERDRADLLADIRGARAEMQRILAKRVPMKFTPHLHFHTDDTAERATQLVQLLDEVDAEDRGRKGGAGG